MVLRVSGGPGGNVTHARIALTNVAPKALRAHAAEQVLIGKPLSDATVNAAAAAAMAIADPVDDLRGDREYKTAMTGQMVQRAIRAAAARAV